MSGEFDAIADVATGSAAAVAVEPATGGQNPGEGACLNCGTVLMGNHCHQCGQKARVHRTLLAFGQDILHSVLHFDGKVWRTLPLLAWKPGDLTRRYVHGERAKFVSPLALFLFSIFLMFAVFSWAGLSLANLDPKISVEDQAKARAEIAEETKGAKEKLARLSAERARRVRTGEPLSGIDGEIAGVEGAINGLNVASKYARTNQPGKELVDVDPTGNKTIDKAVKQAIENPTLLAYKVQTSAYKFSWALIPLSVPFVWLLFFWRRTFHIYDHAVFVTYSLCFMSILAVVLTVAGGIGVPAALIGFTALLIPPVHMYRQLKGAYGLSRTGAILRP